MCTICDVFPQNETVQQNSNHILQRAVRLCTVACDFYGVLLRYGVHRILDVFGGSWPEATFGGGRP
jgi:hypothetical protein